jgi:hypothetical protein
MDALVVLALGLGVLPIKGTPNGVLMIVPISIK